MRKKKRDSRHRARERERKVAMEGEEKRGRRKKGIVKQLAAAEDHDKITAVMNLLTNEFIDSPQANHRKCGLIGLAVATVGLTAEAAQHLEIKARIWRRFSSRLQL